MFYIDLHCDKACFRACYSEAALATSDSFHMRTATNQFLLVLLATIKFNLILTPVYGELFMGSICHKSFVFFFIMRHGSKCATLVFNTLVPLSFGIDIWPVRLGAHGGVPPPRPPRQKCFVQNNHRQRTHVTLGLDNKLMFSSCDITSPNNCLESLFY